MTDEKTTEHPDSDWTLHDIDLYVEPEAPRPRLRMALVWAFLACASALGIYLAPNYTSARVIDAQARQSDRPQVVRFAGEVRDGERSDRAYPFLPPILDEDTHGRYNAAQ